MTRARVHRVVAALGAVLVAAACGRPRQSPGLTFGSGISTGNGVLSGTVVAYGTTTPVVGATVRLGSAVAVSNSSGQFTLTGVPSSGQAIASVVLPGYIPRGELVTLAAMQTGVVLDIIPVNSPFDLMFYRAFARDSLGSSTLLATQHWTMAPQFYIQDLTTDTSTVVPGDVIQSIEDNVTQAVQELTGGRFQVGGFTVGDGAMAVQTGWVIITFSTAAPGGNTGTATLATNMGSMLLQYDPTVASNSFNNPNNCASVTLAAADALVFHVMGFWHTGSAADELSGGGCSGAGRSAIAVYHAALMYSRPPGNIDQDTDTVGATSVPATRIECAWPSGCRR